MLALAPVLVGVGEMVVLAPTFTRTDPAGIFFVFLFAALPASLSGTGAVILWRQPRNTIGWIFCLAGIMAASAVDTGAFARAAMETTGQANGIIPLANWVGAWSFQPAVGLLVAILPLVFPTGRLLSRRWRAVFVFDVVGLAIATLGAAFDPGPLSGSPIPMENPLGIHGIDPVFAVAGTLSGAAALVAFGAGVIALIIRFRRARGQEREQLKWFLYVACITATCFVVSILGPGAISDVAWAAALVSLMFVPVAVGIAILRYRLYEIDVLINRTVVYGGASTILALGFWGANVGAERLVESITSQRSDVISGAVGVGVGLLFPPLRRRLKPVVDRVLPGRAELTLLFTDIVGSTEALAEMGDDRWREVLGRYLSAVRGDIARSGGREVNTAGDAFFATFSQPMAALEAAEAIRSSVQRLGLDVRTGIHLGEVEMRSEQVSGLAVHTAARVMALARPGEILVSDAMRAAVASDAVRFSDRGRHNLKGVPGEWQLHAADGGPAGPGMAR